MSTTLIDGQWYTLPGGERVEARVPYIGSTRLYTQDGQPAYVFDEAIGQWRRSVYDAASDAYVAVPCDLTDDDLRAIP